MNKLHPQIWELVVKSYRHAHDDIYLQRLLQALPFTVEFKTTNDGRKANDEDLMEFLSSLSLDDGLKVIRDALEDESIRKMDKSNWNYFGDFVKYWRGRIVSCLETSGIKYDEENKVFCNLQDKPMKFGVFTAKSEFISSTFDDVFYNELKKEINTSFIFRLFTATFVLSRKMIENLLIDVLRLRFPQNMEGNLILYYRKEGRFHDFSVLLKNLEDKIEDFGVDKHIIHEFLQLVKVFRPQSNSKAHSIIIVGEEKDLIDAKVEKMVELLLKLKQNLISEVRKA